MSLLLYLVLLSADPCLAADFTLATVTKERNTTEKEVVRGDLYVMEAGTVIFAVSSPVNQIMWLKKDTTDIYYPLEGKLFRILTRDSLPDKNTNVSRFIGIDFENQLHKAGLKVKKTESRGDTILLYWTFKQAPTNLDIEIETGRIGEDLVLYRSSAKGNKLEFQFRDFRIAGGKRVPHHLRSMFISRKFSRIEDLRLGKIQTDASLPQSLDGFEFPEDTEIKIVEW
ncbi:hypothetical protein JXM67_05455 [candidate division WOR-3 bacterium]|nr:hypothetical protein [candidate division WOR-3 bacterium]